MSLFVILFFLTMPSFHCTSSRKTEAQVSIFYSTQRTITIQPDTLPSNASPQTPDPILNSTGISPNLTVSSVSTQTTGLQSFIRSRNEHTTTETPVHMITNSWKESDNFFPKNSTGNISLAENVSYFGRQELVANISQYGSGNNVSAPVYYRSTLFDYITISFFGFCCVLGNTINIFVMLLSPLRHVPNTNILVSLAISDTTFILLFPFNKRFFRELLGVDVRSLSRVSCQVFFFFFRTSKMSSAWFVTLIGIERFIAIWFPLKAKIINSKKTIQREIFLVVLVLSTVNLSWSVVGTGFQNGICVPHAAVDGYPNMKKEFVVYGITFVFLLPTLIMLILCPMTVFRLFLNYKSRIHMTNSVHDLKRKNSTNETIRATVMLLSVTLAFVVLTGPITFGHIYTVFTDQDIFESMGGGMDIFRNIAQITELTNFSINFFLYFAISKSYRSYLFSCCRCWVKNVNMKRNSTKTEFSLTT